MITVTVELTEREHDVLYEYVGDLVGHSFELKKNDKEEWLKIEKSHIGLMVLYNKLMAAGLELDFIAEGYRGEKNG